MAVIVGDGGDNALTGTNNVDTLFGLGGDDVLKGGGGDDALIGGTGADTMLGGTGSDVYVVDEADDVVIEFSGQGTDTVESKIDYTLGDNVENLLLLAASGNSSGTGNGLNNQITGNSYTN